MNPTMQEMLQHPLMSQVVSDIEKKKSNELEQLTKATLQASEARAHAVKNAKLAFDAALQAYERGRVELHERLGTLFIANLEYSRITGMSHNSFDEMRWSSIHIPTLKPSADWNVGFSTTQSAYHRYFTSQKWS